MTDHARAIEAGARAKAYIIIAGTGEYSNRSEWPAKVFLDRETAMQTMIALAALEKQFKDALSPIKGYYERLEKEKELSRRAAEEYAALGFADDGHIYDVYVDWHLEESAIASGALVPASAVAEMRERCAAVADKAMIEFTSLLEYHVVSNSKSAAECATLCAKAAREIADKLRQLDTAPASGDYVAVPQSDLTRVIEIARRCEWAPEIERVAVMLNAASSNGGGK